MPPEEEKKNNVQLTMSELVGYPVDENHREFNEIYHNLNECLGCTGTATHEDCERRQKFATSFAFMNPVKLLAFASMVKSEKAIELVSEMFCDVMKLGMSLGIMRERHQNKMLESL